MSEIQASRLLDIESCKTPKGGWTKGTLTQWGVPWPPPRGWKRTIVEHDFPYDHSKNTEAV